MAVAMMLMLLGLITILGIVEVSYLFWAKRDAQKVADLAALTGAQQLTTPATCPTGSLPYTSASNNATANGGTAANGYSTIAISCGGQPASGSSVLVPAAASSVAAIKVDVIRNVNHLFGAGMAWMGTHPVAATAVAINTQPIATFSVGSELASVDSSSPLGNLLNTTLGTAIGLNVLSSNGIANANVSLLGLINSYNNSNCGSPINIGTVSQVLSAPLNFACFANVVVDALPQGGTDPTIQAWLNNISASATLSNAVITLGDILNVNANTSDPNSALNTTINAADILEAALLAADSKNAVAIPVTTASVPGVANVSLMASVVEPPQIGIGGVGTTAHTAQIRLAADISALSALSLVGEPVSDLSIALEVAPSEGTITSIACNATNSSSTTNNVTINVTPGVANVGIAKYSYLTQAFKNTNQTWSSIFNAAQSNQTTGWDSIVNVLNLVTINIFANAQIAATPAFSHTFEVSPSTPFANQSGMTYPSTLSSDPSTESGLLVSSLLNSNIQVGIQVLGGLLSISSASVLGGLTPLLNTLLAPVLQGLVDPLLQTLGIEIGTAQVTLLAPPKCNVGPQLVY